MDNVAHSPIDLERNATWDAESKDLYYTSRQGPWTATSPVSIAFLPLSNYTNKTEVLIDAYSAQSPSQHLRVDTDPTIIEGYSRHKQVLLSHLATAKTAAIEFMWLGGGSRQIQMPFNAAVAHPFSRGFVEINTTDPLAPPVVDLRTGSNPVDIDLCIEAFKFGRRVVQTAAIQRLVPTELAPGLMIQSDDELRTYIKSNASTMFHPSGTAAMQPREFGGVVDCDLRVYGITNLRIVDASIMPLIPATHLQATVYAVAEKVPYPLPPKSVGVAADENR